MKTTHACAALLLAASLTGCIVLPPPPPPFAPPPRPGAAMPPFAHRGSPPEVSDACAGQAEGARFEMPGRRGDTLSGTCERSSDGKLRLRPDGAR
ncbi:hypothetical protein [Variovorax sp. MHTC-1]|uniref:hypothetical protein n=1 Tax=Variovorax sp. MHTC-1 TaxID=2495593 RepID=UPI000F892C06|nr:hypothetical protein [Variovorax sp. MHTC-1]RST55846.1 hypothetical protein EJI01_03520 [Variovorax sp. MHTC-1]